MVGIGAAVSLGLTIDALGIFGATVVRRGAESMFARAEPYVADLFGRQIAASGWAQRLLPGVSRAEEVGAPINAEQLRESLPKARRMTRAPLTAVEGKFFPGALLTFGWWERDPAKSKLAHPNKWIDAPIQQWLFNGFEQWAPSWSVNELSTTKNGCFVGQIGTNDEADSVTVVVTAGDKAAKLREDMGADVVAIAVVAGRLVTYEMLIKALEGKVSAKPEAALDHSAMLEQLKRFRNVGIAPDYYLLVDDADKASSVTLKTAKNVGYYSGYLWQCYAPADASAAGNPGKINLSNSFIVWEHTNFADPDVVAYSMDSLLRKKAFLQQRLADKGLMRDDFILLQHVMDEARLSRGRHDAEAPKIDTLAFLDLFRSGE